MKHSKKKREIKKKEIKHILLIQKKFIHFEKNSYFKTQPQEKKGHEKKSKLYSRQIVGYLCYTNVR